MFLTAIYCFTVGFAVKSTSWSDFHNTQTSSQEKIISDFYGNLFYHTPQSESSLNNFNNLPAPNLKNPFKEFWAINKSSEALLRIEFSQHTIFLRKIPVSHRKSDNLFPFHYFW